MDNHSLRFVELVADVFLRIEGVDPVRLFSPRACEGARISTLT